MSTCSSFSSDRDICEFSLSLVFEGVDGTMVNGNIVTGRLQSISREILSSSQTGCISFGNGEERDGMGKGAGAIKHSSASGCWTVAVRENDRKKAVSDASSVKLATNTFRFVTITLFYHYSLTKMQGRCLC